MDRRLLLQAKLEELLGSGNVYFQPPASKEMLYPCILYKRDSADTKFAGNLPYSVTKRYMVTIIDQDPDSEIPGKVGALPMCIFNRWYPADNLNHDVYVLYF